MSRLILNALAAMARTLGLPETAATLRTIADPLAAAWQFRREE